MGKRDGKVQVLQVSPGEALALQLGQAVAAAAGQALREGGYRPTAEQFREMTARLSREALAAGLTLAGGGLPGLTDDVIDEAAERTARQVISDVLGLPPGAC